MDEWKKNQQKKFKNSSVSFRSPKSESEVKFGNSATKEATRASVSGSKSGKICEWTPGVEGKVVLGSLLGNELTVPCASSGREVNCWLSITPEVVIGTETEVDGIRETVVIGTGRASTETGGCTTGIVSASLASTIVDSTLCNGKLSIPKDNSVCGCKGDVSSTRVESAELLISFSFNVLIFFLPRRETRGFGLDFLRFLFPWKDNSFKT